MSNRRRLTAEPGKLEVAFMPGACLDDSGEVSEMLRRTHDGLIRMVGNTRRSGVTWVHYHGGEDCRRRLDSLYADNTVPHVVAGLDQFRAFFEQAGDRAVLIIASCDVLL
jgi:hypothetical protein